MQDTQKQEEKAVPALVDVISDLFAAGENLLQHPGLRLSLSFSGRNSERGSVIEIKLEDLTSYELAYLAQ